MSVQQLPPMAAGGRWLKTPDNRPPFYVTHEAHIKRLMMEEGATAIDDPRDPTSVRIQSEEADLAKEVAHLRAQLAQKEREEAMRAEIEALRAKITAGATSIKSDALALPPKLPAKALARQ